MTMNYNLTSTKDEAFLAVKDKVNEQMLAKFKVKAKISYDESVKNINAKGKGFELSLKFLDDRVESNLSLSLLLRPLKNKINAELEKELVKVI